MITKQHPVADVPLTTLLRSQTIPIRTTSALGCRVTNRLLHSVNERYAQQSYFMDIFNLQSSRQENNVIALKCAYDIYRVSIGQHILISYREAQLLAIQASAESILTSGSRRAMVSIN